LIVHGHAHFGAPFGRTANGIPVHNASRFVLARHGRRTYCVLEI